MSMSDDPRDLFDELYQIWTNTTGSEFSYWMPELYNDSTKRYKIYSVDQSGNKILVASELNEENAEFIASVHAVVAEMVRELHSALDEADRADYDKDERECRIAELEIELEEMKELARTWGAPV